MLAQASRPKLVVQYWFSSSAIKPLGRIVGDVCSPNLASHSYQVWKHAMKNWPTVEMMMMMSTLRT